MVSGGQAGFAWWQSGNIEYERCEFCNVPLDVSRYHWDIARGVITNPETGRRMALFGPLATEAVLQDLEAELGEAIPETVVEAMRRYIRVAWSDEEWWRDAETFRRMIGVRGMGNLTHFHGTRKGLSLAVQNSTLHLMMVGTVQALVEMAYRADASRVEWSLGEDGDLEISVHLA